MNTWQLMVGSFHEKFGQPIGKLPAMLDNARMHLRVQWMDEELGELETAQASDDLPGVADAIGDLLYFAIGTAVEMGVDLEPIMDAIHAANMQKYRVPGHEKIMKPSTWAPPDIAGELVKQGWTK